MAVTLNIGIKRPENTDIGKELFSLLEKNIDIMSEMLVVTKQNILAADWGSEVDGLFSQTVTIPTNLTNDPRGLRYDTLSIVFRLSDGEIINPKVEQLSDTKTYKIHSNDSSKQFEAIYTT